MYGSAIIDPPWKYGSGAGRRAAADKHYDTMTIAEILAYAKNVIEPMMLVDSHVWIWTTNSMLLEGRPMQIAEVMGYRPLTLVTWVKGKVILEPVGTTDEIVATLSQLLGLRPTKKLWARFLQICLDLLRPVLAPAIGMGSYTRGSTEHLMLAIRGKRGRPAPKPAVPNVFLAPRGRHSAKPVNQYHLVETVSDGPHAEFFARTRRQGWDAYGNEVST
jgi:N6-adenosine-specific RNA methylase IME4